MSEWKEQAIVLHTGLFHESDIWLKVLCQNKGLHTVFAFGGAKSLHRFCGCLDIFNTLNCRITSSRNGKYLILQEARLKDSPQNLRSNWQRMGMAANCLRFVEAFEINMESASECFHLLENLRAALESNRPVSNLLPLFFRLKAATAMGFAPDFNICARCGATSFGAGGFIANEGLLFCNDCLKNLDFEQKRYSILADAGALEMLKFIQTSQPENWTFEFDNQPNLRQCARIIDNFVQYQLGLEWDHGHFKRI